MKSNNVSRISSPPAPKNSTWVQTERASHEAWGHLTIRSPRAAALAHFLVSVIDPTHNSVVMSLSTMALLSKMSLATVRRALSDLEAERWIQIVSIGGKGSVNAVVINDRVAWARSRTDLRLSTFSAQVIVSEKEQRHSIDDSAPLRKIPILRHGERQLPAGPGEPPPSQPMLDGFEPDLPAVEIE